MSHGLRKLQGGGYAVKLCLAPDLVAFADTQWRGQGFADIQAYLNCVLNTAMFHEMEGDPPLPLVVAFDEHDDDIPFDVVPLPTSPQVTKPSISSISAQVTKRRGDRPPSDGSRADGDDVF